MGSFNTTCAISHAPIRPHDKVRLFFLVSKKKYSEDPQDNILSIGCQCYPYDDFRVIGGISIEATYADYNQYEFNEDSIYVRYLKNLIQEEYAENVSEEGKKYNEYHDHMDVNPNSLDWDKILNMIHSGRLFFKTYTGLKPAVAMMAIHESVYNIMINKQQEIYIYDKENSNDSNYKTVGLQYYLEKNLKEKSLSLESDKWKKYYSRFEDKVKKGEMTEKEAIEGAKIFAEYSNLEDRDSEYAHIRNTRSPLNEMRSFAKMYEEQVKKGENNFVMSPYTDEDLIFKYTEGNYFNNVMMMYNFMYRPIVTSGQEYDLSDNVTFLQKVSEALMSLSSKDEEDEHVVTKKMSKNWQELKLSEVISKLKDWHENEEDEDYLEYIENFKIIFKDLKVGETLTIREKEMKYDKYEKLLDLIRNKNLDLEIEVDIEL